MREFKFRAWVSKANKNNYFRSGMYSWEDVKTWVYLWEMIDEGSIILMQYLGWKNKYKQELCEGDVLESDGGVKRTIIYDPNWGWVFDSGTPIYHAKHWKVVGHAYEETN